MMVDTGRLPEAKKWLQRVGSSSALNCRATYLLGHGSIDSVAFHEQVRL
jgi:hypothetical protein